MWWQLWVQQIAQIFKTNPMITAQQLNSIAPSLHSVQAEKIAKALDTICPKYGIDTPKIFNPFLANVLHESNEFKSFSENLNYASERLIPVFGSHRITREQAIVYGRHAGQPANQRMIANTVYGGEWGLKNLGNTTHGDGWLFRGSGILQITGRGNVTAFSVCYNNKFPGLIMPEQMAEKIREDLDIAVHAACWFFAIHAKLIPYALSGNFKGMVIKINGGLKGLEERQRYLDLCNRFVK